MMTYRKAIDPLSAGKPQGCDECCYGLEYLATDIELGMQYLH
ncbi:hypothetical protein [Shewanella marina]|nr:hypothetical protein [Shewanella marina]